jgi:phosphoribosylglycinamide formyltransferase-1
MTDKLRLAVLVSGRGSNLQAILDACGSGSLQAEVAAVLSDNCHPPAFDRIERAGIPAVWVNPQDFAGRADFGRELARRTGGFQPDIVALAGFMRLLTADFLAAFPERVVNIHPALLPSFPGLDAQGQAVQYGVRFSGCTVHFVNEGVDAGPIILQSVVPVLQDDSGETLAARILDQEHLLYPAALQLLAEQRVRIEGGRVRIDWQGRQQPQPDAVALWQQSRMNYGGGSIAAS